MLLFGPRLSNPQSLNEAVEAAAAFLNNAVKPVLVGGSKLRVANAQQSFLDLAESSGYAVAIMPLPECDGTTNSPSGAPLEPPLLEHLEEQIFACSCHTP